MVRSEIDVGAFYKKQFTVKEVQETIKSLASNIISFPQLKETVDGALRIIVCASLLLSNHYKLTKFKYGQVFRLIEIIRSSVEGTLTLFNQAKAQHGDVLVALEYNTSYHAPLIQYSKSIIEYIPPYDVNIGVTASGVIDISNKISQINSPGLNGRLMLSDNRIYVYIESSEMSKIRDHVSPKNKDASPTIKKHQWIKIVSKNEMAQNPVSITSKYNQIVANNKHNYTGIRFTGMEYSVDKCSCLLYQEFMIVRMDFIQPIRTSLGLSTDLSSKYILGVYGKVLQPIEFMRKMHIWDLTRNNCQCIPLIKLAKIIYNK